jgi:bifunctional ADP-heptose synthase (sugar kinase/adenylyltransferase)
MAKKAQSSQMLRLSSITSFERAEVIAQIAKLEKSNLKRLNCKIAVIGDGGVACHELGKILGVCAEAPLPRIAITAQRYFLTGAGGIGSMLKHWGFDAFISAPMGSGYISILQERLMKRDRLRFIPLRAKTPQTTEYTRRIFANNHQLAHLEEQEAIAASSARSLRESRHSLLGAVASCSLLCVVDNGNAAVGDRLVSELAICAKRAKAEILYEPRSDRLLSSPEFGILKVNHLQLKQLIGKDPETDLEALNAAETLMRRSKAKHVVYTRGVKGMLVSQLTAGGREAFVIIPKEKLIFDLVGAGDVVTAALAFGIARGYDLRQAACFAATAAELSLDQRHEKHLTAQFILNQSILNDESRYPRWAERTVKNSMLQAAATKRLSGTCKNIM